MLHRVDSTQDTGQANSSIVRLRFAILCLKIFRREHKTVFIPLYLTILSTFFQCANILSRCGHLLCDVTSPRTSRWFGTSESRNDVALTREVPCFGPSDAALRHATTWCGPPRPHPTPSETLRRATTSRFERNFVMKDLPGSSPLYAAQRRESVANRNWSHSTQQLTSCSSRSSRTELREGWREEGPTLGSLLPAAPPSPQHRAFSRFSELSTTAPLET